MRISIVVTGEPVAKGRPRATVVGGRARMYTPGKTRSWENDARQLARLHLRGDPWAGPIAMHVVAFFAPPQWPAWKMQALERGDRIVHCIKPDLDNLAKAACDALQGIIFLDDKSIVRLTVEKFYATQPRVEITVEEIDGLHTHSKREDLAP